MQTFSVIGAGRLGQSLAKLALLSGQYQIGQLCCRSVNSAQQAQAFVGQGQAVQGMAALQAADIWLLAVPDDEIAAVAAKLAQSSVLQGGALVFHASGVGSVDWLAALTGQNLHLGSLHPAYSFAQPARAVAGFAGTLCALQGEDAACQTLTRFALAIGGRPFRLAADGKAAYHASLSVAANYLVTLGNMAQQLAQQAGVPAELHPDLLGQLMRQVLENTLALGPAAALTGPIARGDASTVAQHLSVLHNPLLRASYLALAKQTLAMAQAQLTPEQHQRLELLLAQS